MGHSTTSRRAATVVWELSQEGTVVVDVDAPVRPFGEVPLTRELKEPPSEIVKREGKRRTLPPLPARS